MKLKAKWIVNYRIQETETSYKEERLPGSRKKVSPATARFRREKGAGGGEKGTNPNTVLRRDLWVMMKEALHKLPQGYGCHFTPMELDLGFLADDDLDIYFGLNYKNPFIKLIIGKKYFWEKYIFGP